MTVAYLSDIDLAVVVIIAIVFFVALFVARRATFTFKDIKATVERTEEHAVEMKRTVGETNGNGDMASMLAKALGQTAEVLQNQEHMKDVEQRLVELSNYTHNGVHRLNGQVGMMWLSWAKEHGYDPDQPPDPQPSPPSEK